MFPLLAEFVTGPNTYYAKDPRQNDGRKRKITFAPECRDVTADSGTDKKSEPDKCF